MSLKKLQDFIFLCDSIKKFYFLSGSYFCQAITFRLLSQGQSKLSYNHNKYKPTSNIDRNAIFVVVEAVFLEYSKKIFSINGSRLPLSCNETNPILGPIEKVYIL